MYFNGQGVPQDYAQAVGWYRKAADQGNALAQLNLGAMHLNGQGVPQDYVLAHMWLNLATVAAAQKLSLGAPNRGAGAASTMSEAEASSAALELPTFAGVKRLTG